MENLKNNIKYIAKLSGTFLLNAVKINLLGALSTAAVFVLGLVSLGNQINVGASGHTSMIPFITVSITTKPVTSILFYLAMVASPYLIFVVASKYATSKVIYKLVSEKSEGIVVPIFDKITTKFKDKQPQVIKSTADFSMAKLKLINEFKTSSENSIIKKIITYVLKKVSLDDVDFLNEELSFYDIIKQKATQKLNELAEPSTQSFWIVVGIQWAILGLLHFTKF